VSEVEINPYEKFLNDAGLLSGGVPGKSAAAVNYVIFFTPRSGSTWLTDMLRSLGTVGNPDEWLNERYLTLELQQLGKVDHATLLRWLVSSHSTANSVFGIEVDFFRLDYADSRFRFMDFFPPETRYFYLTRYNFVAQAISLYRAVESGRFHAVDGASDRSVQYDAGKIRDWVLHVLQQEYGFEVYFRDKRVEPVRYSYEGLCGSPFSVVSDIHWRVLGKAPPSAPASASPYVKLSDSESQAWERQFRDDNHDFIEHWERNRGRLTAY